MSLDEGFIEGDPWDCGIGENATKAPLVAGTGRGFLWSEGFGLGGDGFGGDDVYEAALLALVLELYYAGDLGVEGVVGAAAYVEASLVRCSALTDEDGAAGDGFAVAALDAEPLGV
jgi:hypothetical protein